MIYPRNFLSNKLDATSNFGLTLGPIKTNSNRLGPPTGKTRRKKRRRKKKLFPKVILSDEQVSNIVEYYNNCLSVTKTAKHFKLGINRTRKTLKQANVLLTLSECASLRTGEKNHFFKKTHGSETRDKLSEHAKQRTEKRKPNYKNGKYLRRPRDFKIAEFTRIRNSVFNRDKYTCQITGQVRGHLHAHHLIPYWVCPEAFLDIDNIITVSTKAHFEICHKGDWTLFDVTLISDELLQKYSFQRERLNELAGFKLNLKR